MISRRTWLYLGVSAGAISLGAFLALRRLQPATPRQAALSALWGTELQTPEGNALPLSRFRGHPLLINFWATWCPPCIEEMPLIDAFFQKNKAKNIQVLGIAADKATAVQEFVTRKNIHFPIAIAGMQGVELSRQLGNQAGGLPYTLLIDGAGQVVAQKIGKLSPADLDAWEALLANH